MSGGAAAMGLLEPVSGLGLAVCWGLAVVWLGVLHRPRPRARCPARPDPAPSVAGAEGQVVAPPPASRPDPTAAAGAGLGRWWRRWPRRWRLAAAATVLLTPVAPVALVAVPASCAALGWFAPRRASARRRSAVERGLPEAADLLASSLESGLTVRQALAEAGRWSPEPVGAELRQILVDADRGLPLEAAAQAAGRRLGEAAQPLLSALVAGDRLGVPIAESLRRFVADLAHRRQLDAEARARRLPVRLSLPLVLLVLPAFGLLTVAPTLLAAFIGLGAPPAP